MRKISFTALKDLTLEGTNEKIKLEEVRLHLHFQISSIKFSSYGKTLNYFITNICVPSILQFSGEIQHFFTESMYKGMGTI